MEITIELRRFIEVDNNEAVKIGDMGRKAEAIIVVRPKFDKVSFPNAVLREWVHELMLREGEEGMQRSFINTAKVEAGRWGPPLVDEDWHAVCQAIYKAVEGVEWRTCAASSRR